MKKNLLPTGREVRGAAGGWGGPAAVLAALLVLTGCDEGAPALVQSSVVSGARQLVAAPWGAAEPAGHMRLTGPAAAGDATGRDRDT